MDIDKCEFEVTRTKYLGFIIDVREGIQMDPEKIRAIQEWKAPTSVRGVQAFLGFANYYRKFIRNFSGTVAPLVRLTKKDAPFLWGPDAQTAFDRLKEMFIRQPILLPFDPDRTTVLETDSSGYCVGGILSQYDDEGLLRPCAYYSKKLSPAECNYEIYDKEMLAIIRCLEEWDAELRSAQEFTVITDHKNLEYFMVPRKLSERHVRWALILSRYNLRIEYRPGKQNTGADTLSRREQDMPQGSEDERIKHREFQLVTPEMLKSYPAIRVAATSFSSPELQKLWEEGVNHDQSYRTINKAIKDNARRFPASLRLKVSMSECTLNKDEEPLFRGRRWVPDYEPLRTRLVFEAHDTLLSGHPGRHQTYMTLARDFFWPGMGPYIRRYVRNCDTCGRSKPWRDQKQGLLKPLPVPDRIWKEVSIDYITDLPKSFQCSNLMVVTDRLSKGVIIEPL